MPSARLLGDPMEAYGIAHVWRQGDFVTRGLAIALFVMSVFSWTVIVVKTMNVLRTKRLMVRAEQAFWLSGDLSEGIQSLADESPSVTDNPLLALALSGQAAAEHHELTRSHLHDRLDISDWISRNLRDAMGDCIERMQSGLAILASIGSTSPFIGLFGTVWGIYHALLSIGATGDATINQVAGPVGEALIMTAFGLFVAIPAVIGYNALNRANKTVLSRLNRFAHAIHAFLVTGARLSSSRREAGDR